MEDLLIKKEDLEIALEYYNINIEDYKDKCYKCLDDINKNNELKTRINNVLKLLYSNESEQLELLWKESDLNKFLGKSYNKFSHNIILLSGYKIHEENMGKYNFINIRLIEVGRLQYEYCNNKKGKYIKIHIPKGDKLLYNEVLNSIKNLKKK